MRGKVLSRYYDTNDKVLASTPDEFLMRPQHVCLVRDRPKVRRNINQTGRHTDTQLNALQRHNDSMSKVPDGDAAFIVTELFLQLVCRNVFRIDK